MSLDKEMSANIKYENDQTKIKFAESNGYKVIELWSSATIEENISKIK